MNEFEEFDFQQTETTPRQCEGCAVQAELHSQLVSLSMVKHIIEQAAGSLVGEPGEVFDAFIDETVPEENADEVKKGIRKMTGRNIEELDSVIDETQQRIDANALACSGVLKMRATKGDVTYTVSVCTSPRQYVRDGRARLMQTFVKADSANS